MNGLDDSLNKEKGIVREDKIHGSLLVLNELLRVSNINWERKNDSLLQRLQWDQSQTSAVSKMFNKYYFEYYVKLTKKYILSLTLFIIIFPTFLFSLIINLKLYFHIIPLIFLH